MGLLLSPAGRLLAAASDGCCYLLDPESLRQEARLPLHPSLTGTASCYVHVLCLIPFPHTPDACIVLTGRCRILHRDVANIKQKYLPVQHADTSYFPVVSRGSTD